MASSILKTIFTSRDWAKFQCLSLLKVITFSFLTLIFVHLDLSQQQILFILGAEMALAYLVVEMVSRNLLNQSSSALLRTTLISGLCFAWFALSADKSSLIQVGIFIIGIACLSSATDLFGSKASWSIQKSAERNKTDKVLAFSMAGFISSMFVSISLPVFGFFGDLDISYLLIIIAILLVSIPLLMSLNHYKGTSENNTKKKITKYKDLTLEIKYQMVLSYLFNSFLILGRYFVFPLHFYNVSTTFGVEQGTFRYFGIVLGLVSIIALAAKFRMKPKHIAPYTSLRVGYLSSSFAWIGMAILYNLEHSTTNIIGFLILYFIFEVMVKFWNAGYIARLEEVSIREANDKNESKALYFSYFTNHTKRSKLSVAIAFTIYGLTVSTTEPTYILIVTAICAIAYERYFHRKFITAKTNKPA